MGCLGRERSGSDRSERCNMAKAGNLSSVNHSLSDSSVQGAVAALKAFHRSSETRSIAFRKSRLRELLRGINARESDILDALHADLRKPRQEGYVSEVGFVLSDIKYALRKMDRWARPRRRKGPLLAWPSRGYLYPEPYGAVLIIGPWNYPFQLLLSPLIGAMAAGNSVCLKPSELAPCTSTVVSEMVQEMFSPEYVRVIEGGADTAKELIDQGFDYIFFTGSTGVGRQIMKAAARHLTPVTLELGGKNPCIVLHDVDMRIAARRILWGKCMNAGQTCVAPDHVFVDARVQDEFLAALKEVLAEFFGPAPRKSPDYGRIVNRRHFDRLVDYLDQGRIFCGGERDPDDLFLAPTILVDMEPTASVMQEEVFGPILPVIPFQDVGELMTDLRKRPKPLALYLFTHDHAVQERILAESTSGGVCINDTMSHVFGKDLPFGGIGASGMGSYHGKAGFDCFTHHRSVLRRWMRPDPAFRYPPRRHSLATLKRFYHLMMRR
ncbi:MAG: aldehyde dehydrogenase [Candidatus Hydrogenedentota bacterium]